ncbi:MAG TPA: hypothetical protein VND45_00685 [Thermoanaerobaculia bacterium]|jgi:hypothetical protein|nr:hypothetical protein [Thermoanaerobaculia bacterium]
MLRDSFDYATYWSLLSRIGETHRIVRFGDVREGEPEGDFCILRHDVDYSPRAALRLAEQENERGVRATYFLLAGTGYYNLLAPEHAHVARALVAMGHEVGLHYDVRFFKPFAKEEWPRLLRAQAALLGELAGEAVTSIAMHQPGLHGEDPFGGKELGFVNAYDERFTRAMTYVSDSCRAWRDGAWSMLTSGELPQRLQLALHPINWGEGDRDREAIFREVHEELMAATAEKRDELLAQIACHTGVLEHEARSR